MNALLMDNLQGVRQIKAYGQQLHEDARFAARADDLRRSTLGRMPAALFRAGESIDPCDPVQRRLANGFRQATGRTHEPCEVDLLPVRILRDYDPFDAFPGKSLRGQGRERRYGNHPSTARECHALGYRDRDAHPDERPRADAGHNGIEIGKRDVAAGQNLLDHRQQEPGVVPRSQLVPLDDVAVPLEGDRAGI
jgi:hypothetical protein